MVAALTKAATASGILSAGCGPQAAAAATPTPAVPYLGVGTYAIYRPLTYGQDGTQFKLRERNHHSPGDHRVWPPGLSMSVWLPWKANPQRPADLKCSNAVSAEHAAEPQLEWASLYYQTN